MAYDEDLADHVRDAIPSDTDVTERKMFGGLAFLLKGHMFAGIVGNELIVRLGHEAAQRALERDYVREMDFTGRAGHRAGATGPVPAVAVTGREVRPHVAAHAGHARGQARLISRRPADTGGVDRPRGPDRAVGGIRAPPGRGAAAAPR